MLNCEDKAINILLARRGFSISEMSLIYELACEDCIKRLASEAELNWGTMDAEENSCIFCRLAPLIVGD